jgi:hypothetical protein
VIYLFIYLFTPSTSRAPTKGKKRDLFISTMNLYASLECESDELEEKFSKEAKERKIFTASF